MYFYLGDSGYALRTYMLTPILNPEPAPDTPEARYNERQISTRSIVERCNGLLKMRFRCLLKHRVLHYKPNVASKIINACAVLHNMCISYNVPEPNEELEFDLLGLFEDENVNNAQNVDLVNGRRMQQQLIQNYFS